MQEDNGAALLATMSYGVPEDVMHELHLLIRQGKKMWCHGLEKDRLDCTMLDGGTRSHIGCPNGVIEVLYRDVDDVVGYYRRHTVDETGLHNDLATHSAIHIIDGGKKIVLYVGTDALDHSGVQRRDW